MVEPPVGPAPGMPVVPPAATGDPTPIDLVGIPKPVAELLERRCYTCHQYGIRDPSGWGSALDLSRMIEADIVVPGNLEQSRLWYRVAVKNDMPFNGSRLTPEEKTLLQQWILEMKRPVQRVISNEQILDLIVQDQRRSGSSNDFRYLSFRHLADAGRTEAELKSYEGMTNYLVNSLSRRQGLIRVEPIDDKRSIFRFRISQLGWEAADWNEVVRFYPYCLQSNVAAHQDLYDRLETEAPYLRADWFFVTATQSPLYERLLDLGANLQELEADLGIDIDLNVDNGNVKRIGFGLSGVSANHRIIERHELPNQRGGDYFWWSYDFANRVEATDVRKNPLGPAVVVGDKFDNVFSQAGGEAIFSLPNRMQGYFLTDAAGVFLSEAPVAIVQDPRNRKNNAVRNAIACGGCHGQTGMVYPKAFNEIVRYVEEHQEDFARAEIEEVRKIYPPNGEGILQADANRYLTALRALGPSVTSLISGGGVTEWDFWTTIIGQYEAKVGLRGGALELGIPPETARTLFRRDNTDSEDFLPILISDPLVPRDEWQCKFREVIGQDVRNNVQFCNGSFNVAQLQAACDQINGN